MKNIILDLRGQSLAVLIAEGASVQYRDFVAPFPSDEPRQAAEALARIAGEARVPLDRVHLILPAGMTSVATHRVPVMSLSDAEKMIRRKLVKETGTEEPVFRIHPLASGADRQAYAVETVSGERLSSLLSAFRDRGITVRSVTTAFRANLKALSRTGSGPAERIALIDLGKEHIEFIVASGEELLFYERVAVPAVDAGKDAAAARTPERTEKLRVYRTVESVYTAYVSYQNSCPEMPINAIRISGTGHSLSGIGDVLKESTGIAVAPLNLLGEADAEGPRYTAAFGLALGASDGSIVNFLPRDLAGRLSRTARISLACAYAAVLIASSALLEMRYERTLSALASRQQDIRAQEAALRASEPYLRNRDYLRGLLRRETGLYPLLGYLADNTPEGVYLGGVTVTQKTGIPVVEADFITPPVPEAGAKKLLSKIVEMIDRSGMLSRLGEPSLSLVRQGNSTQLHFKLTCEVPSHEDKR